MRDSHRTVRAIEFYSGIGGLHLALHRSGIPAATIVTAYDWDQTTCQVYAENFGADIVRRTDIATLSAADISRLNADLWLLSPSCQPYTVLNPLAKGASDPRAQSFLHLIDNVLPEMSAHDMHPRRLLVENVAGFQDSSTRHHLVSTLQRLGYVTAEFALNPLQFGIPNSRLRYYLLAKLSPLKFVGLESVKSGHLLDYIPPHHGHHNEPQQTSDTNAVDLRHYIDSTMVEETFTHFRIPDRVLNKWGRLFDIVLPSGTRSCCFTRGYTRLVERAGSILQMNEDLDTTQVFDQFLSARANGDENAVRILDPLRLRYFTPAELLRIFHLSDTDTSSIKFTWPPGVSTKSKYRLIGNSVNVEVRWRHFPRKTVTYNQCHN
ncbi:S-adenosyl-L-methionine-dependent methyltransferase [Boletus reticuloceps]|uniref:S-adenosyl-L-methionine-dependent methyltransferase n=1 Tax=Boletus reticuloceps TaxID=495285 RepID=A0A8I3A7K3_9AGAM|nr:S-adenosyl-L-methionine-dependent methyltransferase [Boletus reticuloceps]